MPAALASDDVFNFSIEHSFAHHEKYFKQKVRTWHGELTRHPIHNGSMSNRRGIPKQGSNWFIREWMDMLGVRQRDMVERCDWSKATASQIYNGVQDYSPKIVKEAAQALNVEPWELLMQPERAMAIRRLQASAETIVRVAHEAGERDGTRG
jgi:hypothetical protein